MSLPRSFEELLRRRVEEETDEWSVAPPPRPKLLLAPRDPRQRARPASISVEPQPGSSTELEWDHEAPGPSTVRPAQLDRVSGLEFYWDADRGYTVADIIELKKSGNWGSRKQNLLSIKSLGQSNYPPPSNSVELNETIPDPPTIMSMCNKLGLPCFPSNKLPAMPKIISRDAEWPTPFVNKLEAMGGESLLLTTPMAVIGTTGKAPTFNQVRRNQGSWILPFRVLQSLEAANPTPQEKALMDEFYSIAYGMASNNFFGTGTVEGQLGRMAKVKAVNDLCTTGEYRIQPAVLQNIDRMLEDSWPMKTPPVGAHLSASFTDLALGAKMVVEKGGHLFEWSPFKVNADADAGFPWPGNKKRGETLIGDILIAHELLADCQAVDAGTLSTQSMRERWNWSVFMKCKAKAEVYETKDMHKKTRNIFVTQAGCMMPAQALFRLATIDKVFATDYRRSSSLTGYRFQYGGMDKLLTTCLNYLEGHPGGTFCAFYSDNIWLARKDQTGEVIWSSIDGDKMEGSHTPEIIQACTKHMLGKCRSHGNQRLAGWVQPYLDRWYHKAILNKISVLGRVGIMQPGMGSGVQGTVWINHAHMATAAAAFRAESRKSVALIDSQGNPTDRCSTIFQRCGIPFKLTQACGGHLNTRSGLSEAKAYPFMPGINGTIAELDLLGWSAAYMRPVGQGRGSWIAVLDRERLYKALLFRKTQYRESTQPDSQLKSELVRNCCDLATMRVLYLTGGWAYPELEPIIRNCASIILEQTLSTLRPDTPLDALYEAIASNMSSQLESLTDQGLGEMVASIGSVMLAQPLPSMEDVLSINLGKEEAKAYRADLERLARDSGDWLRWLSPPTIAMIHEARGGVPEDTINLIGLTKAAQMDLSAVLHNTTEQLQPLPSDTKEDIGAVLLPNFKKKPGSTHSQAESRQLTAIARLAPSAIREDEAEWNKMDERTQAGAVARVMTQITTVSDQLISRVHELYEGRSLADKARLLIRTLTLRSKLPFHAGLPAMVHARELMRPPVRVDAPLKRPASSREQAPPQPPAKTRRVAIA